MRTNCYYACMKRTLILDCNNMVDEDVTICGWVQVRRDHGKILFLDVLDRSATIQVVIGGGKGHDLRPQDVVCIKGKVNKRPENLINKNIPTGEIEIYSEEVEVLSKAEELPFDMGGRDLDLQLPTLLDFRSLTLRHHKVKNIFKVQAAILEGFRKVSKELDCTEIVVPEIAASSTEGGAADFNVDSIAIGKIPRLTLKEAQEVIFKEFGRDNRKEKDLTPQDEIDLCKWSKEKHSSDFVTITHFPTAKRAFYTMPDPKDEEYSLSYDLLFRGVEIMSGSQRINDYQKLVDTIKERGMDPKNFEMYLQAFKYGCPPEGGFSFGLERMTMHMLNLGNVREASLFPRDMERVDVRLSQNK